MDVSIAEAIEYLANEAYSLVKCLETADSEHLKQVLKRSAAVMDLAIRALKEYENAEVTTIG